MNTIHILHGILFHNVLHMLCNLSSMCHRCKKPIRMFTNIVSLVSNLS